MEYIIVAITVLIGASLTFFSGFGLGTLMLPVFSLFFDLPVAIGATAIVHMANNIFKFAIVYKYIHYRILLLFGGPAIVFAFLGGYVLTYFSQFETFYSYHIGSYQFNMNIVSVIIGFLMIFFAWFDLDPRFDKLQISQKHIPFGGMLSGFFGGLSGHQGAFRSAFLTKSNLTKEQFIGTSNAVSLLVDIGRLTTYFIVAMSIQSDQSFLKAFTDGKTLLIIGIVFAFFGTYFGKKLIQKTTIGGIRKLVGVLLFAMGTLMIFGII